MGIPFFSFSFLQSVRQRKAKLSPAALHWQGCFRALIGHPSPRERGAC